MISNQGNQENQVNHGLDDGKESYNLLMSMTALDLSPEALKKYHPLEAIRRRRAKFSAEISARRKRAMSAARKAAKLLKSEFGASEIILFGSLARRVGFNRWSDIDLAARGVTDYLKAMDTVLYLVPEFKIDLVELETCPPTLLENITREGKTL
jgi:predicted nucleotidyltransferase